MCRTIEESGRGNSGSGGRIQFEQGDTVGECESCSIKQTLPRLDSDKKMNLYCT